MKANWGPPQSSMKWLYTGVIRPGITYGCLVWGRTVMTQFQDELRRVQGLALMMQGLFRKNTPRRSLEVLSGVEPLHLFIFNQMMKSGYRNLDHINRLITPSISPLTTVVYILSELKSLNIPTNTNLLDRIPKIRWHERNFELSTDTFKIKWPKIERENINVFTDGSLLGGNTGLGVYIDDKGKDISLSTPMPKYSTVFQCEVSAVLRAAEVLTNTKDRNIQFYVDSQAAIQSLTSDEIRSRTVLETVLLLDQLGNENKVTLNWIKAHNGHAMNDIADKLAREGSMAMGPHPQVPIPDSHVKELIDKETLKRWNNGWVNVDGHRQAKLFFPIVDKIKASKLYKTSKSIYSQAIR